MPTYEFRCPNGHTFEQFHKISDAPSTAACPTCGAEAVRAISGGAGLVFKGSGFYLTDYGKNAHRTSGPPKSGESGGESSGGESAGGGKSSDAGSGAGGGSTASPSSGSPSTESKSTESKSTSPKGGEKGAA